MRTARWPLAALIALAACTPTPEGDEPTPDAAIEADAGSEPSGAETWYGGVGAIVRQRCAACHREGGSAPFDLTDGEAARTLAPAIADAVRSGRMPPWRFDPDCRSYLGERRLTDAERDALLAWAEGEAPLGTPAALPDPPSTGELEPPLIAAAPPTPYTPDDTAPDDYRCFPLDVDFEVDTYVTGYALHPGVDGLVHHVALFTIFDAGLEQMNALDAAADGTGYPCFGGPGVNATEFFGAWVPGSDLVRFPEDAAYVIPRGARVVMQVHYNTAVGATADLTTVELATRPDPPALRLRQIPFVDLDIVIPAGEPASTHTSRWTHDDPTPWQAIGVLPHMHLRGRHIRMHVEHADGRESCLVDVPDWDFQWQENALFEQWTEIGPGDAIELTCVFDNSAENQPVIGGEATPVQEVRWGEGTNDEMCASGLTIVTPFETETPVDPDACVQPGDPGNELGVGRFCTVSGDCDGEASLCLAAFVPDRTYCTIIGCAEDVDCGSDAFCGIDAAGSACIPVACR